MAMATINDASADDRVVRLLESWYEKLGEMGSGGDAVPAIVSNLAAVWDASDYVAQCCLREPALLFGLHADGLLQRPSDPGALADRLVGALSAVADPESLEASLRRFRKREMVRIIWRDISGAAALSETMESLTELADACIRQTLDLLYQWRIERDGVPRDAAGRQQQLVVLGMGKLGARELNLSSDIDLIFAFPQHGEADGPRRVPNEEFFTRLGRDLINALGRMTVDGFVFRVDMRLRPFGEAGPLAMSFDALESYYESQARDWERYAMIKARVIAGDARAGAELTEMLRPFVYRRYIDFGAINSIRNMKRMISQELRKQGMDENIKLGLGGIREIEFIGQAFQLVRGGRDSDLQIRPSLAVLKRLGSKDLLPRFSVRELSEAYEFLRLTENRLQAWKDEQTHKLPRDEASRTRLARSMNHPDWTSFIEALDRHRERVHQQFDQVFATPHADDDAPDALLAMVWLAEERSDRLAARLKDCGYAEPEQVLEQLAKFRDSVACRSLSARGRERLDQLVPMLLDVTAHAPNPDLTLRRLLSLLTAIVRRTAYLDLLMENPLALSQLVRLSGESSWIVGQLIRQPILMDELLDARRLYTPLRRQELDVELDAMLGQLYPDDLEQQMERLRQFAQGNMLRVAAADLTDVIPLRVVSDYLTDIAEAVLTRTVGLAWSHLLAKHGAPTEITGAETGFAIIGYGKLGGIELGYGSDLDLVFLHGSQNPMAMTAGGEARRQIANDVFYARMGQRVIHLLTTRTPSGILYEVDMRLRPNGNAGQLVSSLNAFDTYQENEAWTWEHQALLRARAIAGDPVVQARFEAIRRHVLSRERDAEALRHDVIEMRAKMRRALDKSEPGQFDLKQGPGGIADIEFMVQYAILRWASQYPDLLDWSDNLRLLEGLGRHALLAGDDAELLADTYQVFRAVYHRSALQEAPGLMPDERLREERQMVRDIWQTLMGEPV